MELVAEEFSKISGFPVNNNLIERIKDTKPQYKLSKLERMENLENAFIVNKSADLGLPILLIDDICTSGSTFESIIQELNKQGIDSITAFATTSPYS